MFVLQPGEYTYYMLHKLQKCNKMKIRKEKKRTCEHLNVIILNPSCQEFRDFIF